MKQYRSRAGTSKTKTYRRRRRHKSFDLIPRIVSRTLLSRGELAFFRVLRRVIAGRCLISLKTRLADIVHCPASQWNRPFGRKIAQKHVDFVIYNGFTAVILAVIELDDRSHQRADRISRDKFLDATLRQAGIVLIRIQAASSYDAANLQTRIDPVLDMSRRAMPKTDFTSAQ